MDEINYTLLTEVYGRWEADIIAAFLTAEDIDVVLIHDTLSDLFTPSFAPVKIYVAKESIQQARELLKTYDESKQDDEE